MSNIKCIQQLTKDPGIVRKRYICMLNFKEHLRRWRLNKTIFFPSSHSPYEVACLEVWMLGIQNFGHSIPRDSLQTLTISVQFSITIFSNKEMKISTPMLNQEDLWHDNKASCAEFIPLVLP